MITQQTTETQTKSIHESTSTGTIVKTNSESVKVDKTPLTITKVVTDQRTQALKSKGFDKVNDSMYVKRFDDTGSQRMLFITFKNNTVSIINREHTLDLGDTIFESNNVQYLEEIEEYLN